MSNNKRPAASAAASAPGGGAVRGGNASRIAVLVLVAATVVVVVAVRPRRGSVSPAPLPVSAPMVSHEATALVGGIPRLIDLGADKCIPCKTMAPILVELRSEYAGRFQVDFIDVWKNPDAGGPYNIYAIPTQIFFDGAGKELTRHQGFISKADILATWKRFGYDFGAAGAATPRS